MTDWDITEHRITHFHLFKDGVLIRNTAGAPNDFATREEAQFAADNWAQVRCPTYAELKAMPDDELMARHDAWVLTRPSTPR